METHPHLSTRDPLCGWERGVFALDILLGVSLCGVAVWLVVGGLAEGADPNSPHGGAFAFLGAFLFGPPGVLFLLAAFAVARRWQVRWWLHALPFVLPVLLGAFGLGLRGL